MANSVTQPSILSTLVALNQLGYLPNQYGSCKEVYLSKNRNNSGEYILYHDENPFKVYCFFEGDWVYTFISKSSYNTSIDLSKLYNTRNFAKVRIRWNNGTQNEVTVENLTGYQHKSDLFFGYNNHTSYQGPESKNVNYMSPYLFLGFLPISLARDKTIQGYCAGDRDFTFRNCDANPNSYITFYFNPNSSHPRRVGYSDMYNVNFMTGWMSHSSLIDSSLSMGSEFYFDFEMHMGGCGGFMTSYYLSNITVALGLPFELLKNSKEHEEELRDMNMTKTDNCPSGQFYDPSATICTPCERNHYQHRRGQNFCYSCPRGMITSGKGSNSSDSCYRRNDDEGSVRNTTYSGKISEDTSNAGMIIGLTVGLVLLICGSMTVVIMVKVCKRLTTGSVDTAAIVNNQDHEHSNQEINNINQGFQNVVSIPNSPVVSNNENVDDDHYASTHEMNLANSSSNNDQYEDVEQTMETTNL
ncbi:unnamed protein product [Mytilus coruscus]|uniref:Tyrosine-protein kinase ephrin type A/B receptor-like domain-containing protein n=1 Tax=Mytilus coruscus TaxID=42192 RepID=A0A6J8F5A7_MYTCO|nr:unnamed protein product [Mytilus coruscus]